MAKKEREEEEEEIIEFESDTLKDFKEPIFEPVLIPGINAQQINQDISIET